MIKDLRQSKGLTQQALADAAGVHIRRVQKYESGECAIENMTLGFALKICAVLDCRPEDLLTKDE